jgi:membrane protein
MKKGALKRCSKPEGNDSVTVVVPGIPFYKNVKTLRMKFLRDAKTILLQAWDGFLDDWCVKLAASLSYFTIFAVAPLLLIIISIVGSIFGLDAVQGKVYEELRELVGSEAAIQIQSIIANIQQRHNTTLGTIIGIVILFVAATGVFTEIQSSINYIWSVKAKPKKGWLKFLINRLLSFVLVLGLGFLLVISLIGSTILSVLGSKLTRHFPHYTVYLINTINVVLLLISITSLFMVIYKVLPDAVISWRDALVGALFTSLLFMMGRYLISLYLQHANLGVTYGTAASIIILLSWVYYSSIILYFGAEFTKAFALESGHGIRTKSTAVFIIKREEKEIPQSRLN